jgi:AcrR family transcriptional regulator
MAATKRADSGRRRSRPEAMKRAIIESAIRLFSAHGHAATKMSDIAADVSGSKETLYRHFPSKEVLFDAVVQSLAEVDFQSVEAMLTGDAPLTERVHMFARAYMEHILDPRIVALRRMVALEAHRSKTARRVYEENAVPPWRVIASSLKRQMRRNALRQADPWRAAMHLKALIEGDFPRLVDLRAIDPPTRTMRRRIADEAAQVFLRAYAPERTARNDMAERASASDRIHLKLVTRNRKI